MSGTPHGIQTLMAAEKKASELINNARKRKKFRLKNAKEEALSEIEQFKNEFEENFRQKLREHDNSEALKEYAELQKAEKLEEMKQKVYENKEKTIKEIIDCVKDIRPSIHVNYEYLT